MKAKRKQPIRRELKAALTSHPGSGATSDVKVQTKRELFGGMYGLGQQGNDCTMRLLVLPPGTQPPVHASSEYKTGPEDCPSGYGERWTSISFNECEPVTDMVPRDGGSYTTLNGRGPAMSGGNRAPVEAAGIVATSTEL